MRRTIIIEVWTRSAILAYLGGAEWGSNAAVAMKIQRLYLKHYYNNPVGAVTWQYDLVT